AAAHLALDGDRAVELLDDPLRDREAEPEAAALGRDEVVEDRREPLRWDSRSGVGHADLDPVADARGGDRHAAARLCGLNRVRDQIAVDAAEREAVALDDGPP